MAIQDTFSDSSRGSRNPLRALSAGFTQGKTDLVRDEFRQIKAFYTNTLSLQKELKKKTGNDLPPKLVDMMESAIRGFDNILDQTTAVDSDQAKATLNLVDKIAASKGSSDTIPVMNQLKKISDRQNLQTIANQNAQARLEITSKALGQSVTGFLSSNIDTISNSDLGRELGESLPLALSGPFAPVVGALDDLVDFRGTAGAIKQKAADSFNRIFKRNSDADEDEADDLIRAVEDGADRTTDKIEKLNEDQFFTQNTFQDGQRHFQEELLGRLDTFQDLTEDQNEILGDIEKQDGFDFGGVPDVDLPGGGRAGKAKSGRFGFLRGKGGLVGGLAGGLAGAGGAIKTFGGKALEGAGRFGARASAVGRGAAGGALGKLGAVGIGVGLITSFSSAIEDLGKLDASEIEAKGGFFSAALTGTFDKFTLGITTKLSDGLRSLIADNDIARMITDPIFGAISNISSFVSGMFDDPLATLKETGANIASFFTTVYPDHIEEPLKSTFNSMRDFFSNLYDEYVGVHVERLGTQLGEFFERYKPDFIKRIEAGDAAEALEDRGIIKDRSGLDFRQSSIDFGKTGGLGLDELTTIQARLQGDLSDDDQSKLAALITKAKAPPSVSDNVVPFPKRGPDPATQRVIDSLLGVEKAVKAAGNGQPIIMGGGGGADDLRLHSDNAALDMVNISTP